jgi:hypothetical protein
MTFEFERDRSTSRAHRHPGPSTSVRAEHGRSTWARPNTSAAPSHPPSTRRLEQRSDAQTPRPDGAATLTQESPPTWLRDAIDVIVVAAVLLTVALAAVLGN